MSRRARLYAAELAAGASDGDVVVLEPAASAHLAQVLRARRGEEVAVFDGRGNEYLALVEAPDKRACGIRLTQILRSQPPPTQRLHLVQAAIKSGLEGVIQQATELGATDITIFRAERSARGSFLRLDRAVRIATGAAEQSGRLFLPNVTTTSTFSEALTHANNGERLIAMPNAPPLDAAPNDHSATIAIGPEGGFTDLEINDALEADFRPFSLGHLTLRAATAAPAALAALRQLQGWR